MNLNPLQIMGIVMVVNSALIGATAQLTSMFGQVVATDIVTICSIGNTIIAGLTTLFSGQGNLIKSVAAMPGVEKITVNSQANQALATVATDSTQPKVGATDAGTRAILQDTAKGV